MQPLSRRSLLSFAAAVAVLPGCGFALRGAPRFAFQSVRFKGSETTPVARELQLTLQGVGLRVFSSQLPGSPEGETGDVVLTVLKDQRERSVVGLTTAGEVRELQLRTRFVFRLATAQGGELLGDTELLLTRDISYTETAALAKEAEEALQYRDMQRDIVQQVMRRLAAVRMA